MANNSKQYCLYICLVSTNHNKTQYQQLINWYEEYCTILLLKLIKLHCYLCSEMPVGDDTVSFGEWSDMQCAEQPQFKYNIGNWRLQLELMVLQYVRSIRKRNFTVYVQCLLQIVPWIFGIDHTNYCRWLPVHISDMVNLPNNHPEIYRQFKKGNFAVQKTKNAFSALAIDRCHERANELIKGDGGAVGLTENPQPLERSMASGRRYHMLYLTLKKVYK